MSEAALVDQPAEKTGAAPPRLAELPAWFPPWARELGELYFSGTTCLFLLYGNVHDLIWRPSATAEKRSPSQISAEGEYCSLAEFLATQETVERVTFPGLPGHEDYALAQRLLPHGPGAVFSFELKGGRAAGRKFIEALQVFSHLANVGDAKSLVIHPPSTTHARLDAAALARAGIPEGHLADYFVSSL